MEKIQKSKSGKTVLVLSHLGCRRCLIEIKSRQKIFFHSIAS